MMILEIVLLVFLIVCAVTACINKNLFSTVIIFMSYSSIMCVVWLLLRSPDLAITEAAVGAGVTSILFFITLKNINQLKEEDEKDEE
ncbi:MAG: DUF4040 domain-containing protein [Oscillospiraceae bacterium]|nr:DUF4040 domain-containing protein [Oscillospiraceae bacterium]